MEIEKKVVVREISPLGDESMLDHDPNKGRTINTLFQLKNVRKTQTY